jgi:hypothetical protein
VVSSNTSIANLNADLLDGKHASSLSGIGDCPSGQFVQNLTSGQPECKAVSGGGINGGGALNYISMWNSSSSLNSSLLYQTSGRIGVGMTNPAYTLDVAGAAGLAGNLDMNGYYVSSAGRVYLGGSRYLSDGGSPNGITASDNLTAAYVKGTSGLCIGTVCMSSWPSGGGSPGGSNGQVQYNNGGAFGGAANLYYNSSSGNVGINDATPSYDLDVSGSIRATSQLISSVATGTAPLVVSSNTSIANLNADLLDGKHSTSFSPIGDCGVGKAVQNLTSTNLECVALPSGGSPVGSEGLVQ